MGDTLAAGNGAVALRCKYCQAWHMDTGSNAVHPHRVHVCQQCGNRFQSPIPTIGHPFSVLQPVLQGRTLGFANKALPDVQVVFEGMDHLASQLDLLTISEAIDYLHTIGVAPSPGSNVLRGAQKLKTMLTLNPATVNPKLDTTTRAAYL